LKGLGKFINIIKKYIKSLKEKIMIFNSLEGAVALHIPRPGVEIYM
jgi:hypothetical protein